MTEHPLLFALIMIVCSVGVFSGMPDGREYEDEDEDEDEEET